MISEVLNKKCVAVEPIYAAAFEGDFYSVALDVLAHALPGAAVVIFGQNTVQLSGHFLLHRGLPVEIGHAYMTDLASKNAWFQRQWQQDVGVVYQDRDLVDVDDLRQGQVYRQLQSCSPPLERTMGVVISRCGTRQVALEIRYQKGWENAIQANLTELLERFAQHLVWAARISELRRDHMLGQRLSESLLELISFPTLLIDAECHVLQMNARGEALVSRRSGLAVSPDGFLCSLNPQSEAELKATVTRLSSSLNQRVAMMMMPATDGQGRQIITVAKLGNRSASGGPSGRYILDSCTRFAVISQSVDEHLDLNHDALWQIYKLSAKEAELAISLLEGATIGEYAAKAQVSKQTLRNRLGAVMRKTETSRQPELVALLTRVALSASM